MDFQISLTESGSKHLVPRKYTSVYGPRYFCKGSEMAVPAQSGAARDQALFVWRWGNLAVVMMTRISRQLNPLLMSFPKKLKLQKKHPHLNTYIVMPTCTYTLYCIHVHVYTLLPWLHVTSKAPLLQHTTKTTNCVVLYTPQDAI